MIVIAFLIGGIVSALLLMILALSLGANDVGSLILLSTSCIIAELCGCSAWIVKTIKNK
jgi:hypothetical protein